MSGERYCAEGLRIQQKGAFRQRQENEDTREGAALCAQTDPEEFFPEKGGSTKRAKKVCALCDIREPCLQRALDDDERFGVWGGLSERERRKLKQRQVV